MLDHGCFSFLSLLNRLKWNDLVTVSCQCKLLQVKGYALTHHSPGASICPCCTMLIALMIIVSFTLMSLKAKTVKRTVKLDLSKDGSWRSHWWNENKDENNFFFLTVEYSESCVLKILQNFLLFLHVQILFGVETSCEVSRFVNLQKYSCFSIFIKSIWHISFFTVAVGPFLKIVFHKITSSVLQRSIQ